MSEGELGMNLRGIWARAYVRIVGVNRELSWLLFELLFPLFPICSFCFIYKSMKAPDDYLGFVILGGATVAIWMNVIWGMAAQFFWERESGNLTLYMLCPLDTMSVLIGMAVGSGFSTLLRLIITVMIGKLLFGVQFFVTSYLWLFVTLAVTIASVFCLGMMMSSFFLLYGRDAWNVLTIFMEPVFFLSGFYFPVRSLGLTVGAVASLIPITLGLDAMRQLCFKLGPANGFLPVGAEISILALLSIVYFLMARFLLAKIEYIGRREGRLTLRWQ